jgi:hypothetical protein
MDKNKEPLQIDVKIGIEVLTIGLYPKERQIVINLAKEQFENNFSLAIRHIIRDWQQWQQLIREQQRNPLSQ